MKQYALSQMSFTFEGVCFCLKNRVLRFWFSFVLSVFFMISPALRVVSYADVNDLMISTGSNAVVFSLPRSSVGTVTNTTDGALIAVRYTNGTYNNASFITPELVDGRWKFNFAMPSSMSGYWINEVNFYLQSDSMNFDALPSPPGNYTFSMDFASDFSYNMVSSSRLNLFSVYKPDNSDLEYSYLYLDYIENSGDFYIYPASVNFGSSYNNVRLRIYISESDRLRNFGGSYAIAHKMTAESGGELVGSKLDYGNELQGQISQNTGQMADSLSDISSSMSDQADAIESVADAIQNLQGAMEPHYNNVLTQLHHITEQLHALWDQQYNLHHVPLMAKLDEIKSAIANMDLEVVVELDELKQTVNNMSQAIQNKLQSVQDGINNKLQSVQDTLTGGYNTGGIDSDQGKLEDSLNEYEEAEKNVIDKVNDSLNDFEFDSGFEEYSNTISTISDFLQALYDSSGGFKVVINLSLMLSLASLVIGFYRFKG